MAEPAPAVHVQDLEKTYRVYAKPWHRLVEAVSGKQLHEEFHALQGVDFALQPGEGLGIVGENGAGKSTLLKILAGVTAPSAGAARVDGKVAAILELGSGFHPEFTGRQNIQLNAAMLGLTPEEVAAKTPDIIAFSELGAFIDQPVKNYSSGMAMRLGFSIATQVEPQVLIIDEALSVGDGYFQKKCMDRLQQYIAGGGTLLLCSHAMYYVTSFCQRALWLREGRAEALGPVDSVVREYESFLDRKSAAAEGRAPEAADPAGGAPQGPAEAKPGEGGPARITGVEVLGPEEPREVDGARAPGGPVFAPGDRWRLTVSWKADSARVETHLGIAINSGAGVELVSVATHQDGLVPFSGRRRHAVELELPRLPLVKGEFLLHVFLLDESGYHVYDHRTLPAAFSVVSRRYRFGLVDVEHHWRALEDPGRDDEPVRMTS